MLTSLLLPSTPFENADIFMLIRKSETAHFRNISGFIENTEIHLKKKEIRENTFMYSKFYLLLISQYNIPRAFIK